MKMRVCELCNGEASLYCESDSAFLCWNCDVRVHEANFLVARHVRRTVCSKCKGFDGNCFSGVGFRICRPICRSCSSESDKDCFDSSSSSSTCISSAESFGAAATKTKKIAFKRGRPAKISSSGSVTDVSGENSRFLTKFSCEDSSTKTKRKTTVESRAPTRVDVKAEGILVNWCRKLGLKNSCSVPLAFHAFTVFSHKMTGLPFRISLASSLWFALKLREGKSSYTCQNLKKLEEISGVPAKLILMAESKISRVFEINRRSEIEIDQEEGWAESASGSVEPN